MRLHRFITDIDTDMEHITEASWQRGRLLYYLTFPLIWLIALANKLKFFSFDLFYALALVSLGLGLWF